LWNDIFLSSSSSSSSSSLFLRQNYAAISVCSLSSSIAAISIFLTLAVRGHECQVRCASLRSDRYYRINHWRLGRLKKHNAMNIFLWLFFLQKSDCFSENMTTLSKLPPTERGGEARASSSVHDSNTISHPKWWDR
jgi:hypothetical protein